jgi:hypothetical protein
MYCGHPASGPGSGSLVNTEALIAAHLHNEVIKYMIHPTHGRLLSDEHQQ